MSVPYRKATQLAVDPVVALIDAFYEGRKKFFEINPPKMKIDCGTSWSIATMRRSLMKPRQSLRCRRRRLC
jgi:hypothetical protein